MDRKEFLTKTCKIGILSSCTSIGAGSICNNILADDKKKNPNETPCEEKAEFAKTWLSRFMEQIDANLDEETRKILMMCNGKACYRGAYGNNNVSKDESGLKKFVDFYRKATGDENSIIVEGDTIRYYYVGNPKGLKVSDGYCLCPIIEDGPKTLSPTYCNCSVGYVTEMFKDITNKEVKVELKESLRSGGKRCRFEIRILS